MLERSVPFLKGICLVLGVLVLYQVSRFTRGHDPLHDLRLPSTPFSPKNPRPLPEAKATNSAPRLDRGKKDVNISPAAQARVERITQSEILGPVQRPLPMALLGIAGRDAFLRAPNGQTGLLKEGDELGGIKLLRIAHNRVLIEHDGQKKELTMFSGFGSETLIPKEKEKLQ
jgi:hypothetical protein